MSYQHRKLNLRSPSPPAANTWGQQSQTFPQVMYQDVARDKLSKAAFIAIEWFHKATIAVRHHIYKRLKPHTDKKSKKEDKV